MVNIVCVYECVCVFLCVCVSLCLCGCVGVGVILKIKLYSAALTLNPKP
jgi:hypothetical protein